MFDGREQYGKKLDLINNLLSCRLGYLRAVAQALKGGWKQMDDNSRKNRSFRRKMNQKNINKLLSICL